MKIDVIDGGYARGVSDDQIAALEEEVEESTIKLTNDLNLFGENENREK